MTSTRRGSYKLPLQAQPRPAPGLPKLLICLTLALLLPVSGLATISGSSWAGVGVSPTLISQDGYIWENDDGNSPDSNSAQAAANTAITGVRKGERLTARIQLTNTGNTLTDDHKLGLFYDRGDGY